MLAETADALLASAERRGKEEKATAAVWYEGICCVYAGTLVVKLKRKMFWLYRYWNLIVLIYLSL